MSTFQGESGRTGREYLRVSYDRSGRERSQDEQHEDNARVMAEAGVLLKEPYREAGSASASRYGTKTRDDFARLLADLEAGRFGAQVLVLWESSRGSRKVGEWVTLIELCEAAGVSIHVTTHGREYQPGNARDRRSLLEDAVDSEYESSKVSARAKRASAANARDGKPHGRTPFGYVRRYDEVTRVLIAQEPHPEQAPLIRELFALLKAGHSLRSVERAFAARGVVNRSGEPFTAQHLRVLALTPAYAGIRVHRTREARATEPKRAVGLSADAVQVEATWPGLVSRADFLAVQSILCDPERLTTRPGRAKHLLSLIAKCDVCGGWLSVRLRNGDRVEYQCATSGHVLCNKAELDQYAEAAILGYLARPDVHESLTAGEGTASTELGQLRDDLAQARHELEALRAQVAAGRLSVASLVAVEPGMLSRVQELQARESELSTPSALRGLIAPGADVAARWAQAPVSARREVARLLLTEPLLGELRVARRERHGHVPISERVRFRQVPATLDSRATPEGPA